MEIHECWSHRVETPDGTMFVHVSEDADGRPIMLQLNIGKVGNALSAWSQVTALLVSNLLARGVSINDIIVVLSENTSDRRILTHDGVPVRSGPDGLCVALIAYRRAKYRELQETLRGSESDGYRAPSFMED